MAVEVKKRLDAIDMVGRSITLKIMKRDPTAPVEPPKVFLNKLCDGPQLISFQFLGHGRCDLFNKQMPLIAPGGKATSDDQIIGENAWRLLKSFNFDPKELRGLGIQVQKLESSSVSTNAPPGQAVLQFRSKVGSSKDEPRISNQLPSHAGDIAIGDPVKPTVTFDLPSFSQVNRSVFDALPRDVREELQNEYKRRSASPFTSGAPPAAPANDDVPRPPGPFGNRSNTPSFFPPKPPHRGPNVNRITQQLGPRSRASISPHKSALYHWAMRMAEKEKKKKAAGVRITDAALLDLKLDPEVFKVLPTKVQREQLIMARIIKEKGRLPEPPKERKVLKPKKHELPPDFVPYRAPKPKARYLPPPFLRQQGKTKKEKLHFTETDDIQRIVETWVNTYRHWPPKEKDVEFLAKFIVQSTDRAQASDVGVERAVAIMKWWIVLLRRFFPASEIMEEEDLALSASQRNLVGEAWWGALHGIQDQMDVITRKRFGGRLSLR
jgi:DNA repair protein REV1